MEKQTGPSLDVTQSMTEVDLTKGADELLKMLAQIKVPGIDMDAMVASQRGNLEALANANRAAFGGMRGVAEWQLKILQEAVLEISAGTSEIAEANSPQDAMLRQTEVARRAFEKALTNMRELAEILNETNQAVTRAISERVRESVEEIRDVLQMARPPKGR